MTAIWYTSISFRIQIVELFEMNPVRLDLNMFILEFLYDYRILSRRLAALHLHNVGVFRVIECQAARSGAKEERFVFYTKTRARMRLHVRIEPKTIKSDCPLTRRQISVTVRIHNENASSSQKHRSAIPNGEGGRRPKSITDVLRMYFP